MKGLNGTHSGRIGRDTQWHVALSVLLFLFFFLFFVRPSGLMNTSLSSSLCCGFFTLPLHSNYSLLRVFCFGFLARRCCVQSEFLPLTHVGVNFVASVLYWLKRLALGNSVVLDVFASKDCFIYTVCMVAFDRRPPLPSPPHILPLSMDIDRNDMFIIICVFLSFAWNVVSKADHSLHGPGLTGPQREAGDFWCLPPVWNLRALSLFPLFYISSLVLLLCPVALSVVSFSAFGPFFWIRFL